MATPDFAKITVDDAIACIVPDAMGCIEAMNSDYSSFVQTDFNDLSVIDRGLSSPVSMSAFEFPPCDSHSEAPSQSPTGSESPAPPPSVTKRPRSSSAKRKTDRRAIAWTKEEHELFLTALERFCPQAASLTESSLGNHSVGLGPGVAQKIADMLGTRNANQVRSHAQKYFHSERRKQE
eukprot:2105723-Rhodomonas_salina.1